MLATPRGAAVVGLPGGSQQASPLHFAAANGRLAIARRLVAAAPSAGAFTDRDGEVPLALALDNRRLRVARLLLRRADLPPNDTPELLGLLAETGAAARHLYPLLAARMPLTPAQWRSIPPGCPGLAAALPAVLARSASEARCLVACLPADDRAALRAGALALARAQRSAGVELPPALVTRLLLEALAPAAREEEAEEEELSEDEEAEEEEEGSEDEAPGGSAGLTFDQFVQLFGGMGGTGGGAPGLGA